MTLDVQVRVARPADAKTLQPLFEQVYGAHFETKTAGAIARHLRADAPVDTVLLATVRGAGAGFASRRVLPQIESDAPHAEPTDIFVNPTHRGRGVGGALLRRAEDLARSHGASRMVLTAGRENRDAMTLCRAAGHREFAATLSKGLRRP